MTQDIQEDYLTPAARLKVTILSHVDSRVKQQALQMLFGVHINHRMDVCRQVSKYIDGLKAENRFQPIGLAVLEALITSTTEGVNYGGSGGGRTPSNMTDQSGSDRFGV